MCTLKLKNSRNSRNSKKFISYKKLTTTDIKLIKTLAALMIRGITFAFYDSVGTVLKTEATMFLSAIQAKFSILFQIQNETTTYEHVIIGMHSHKKTKTKKQHQNQIIVQ